MEAAQAERWQALERGISERDEVTHLHDRLNYVYGLTNA